MITLIPGPSPTEGGLGWGSGKESNKMKQPQVWHYGLVAQVGNYSDEPATADHTALVFVARK